MFSNNDPLKEEKIKLFQLLIYFVPVIGFLPALWKSYTNKGTTEEKKVSRVSANLGIIWLFTYILLWTGSVSTSEFVSFRLMYLNGLVTSGYFLICIFFMIRLWQGKLPKG